MVCGTVISNADIELIGHALFHSVTFSSVWPSIEMFEFPDHFLPPCCSIQRNGEGRICFSSQRTQGPTLHHHQKFFDWKSSYCRISHRSLNTSVNASGQQLQSEPETHDSTTIWRAISSSLDAFYRFSRPHTVIGTVKSRWCTVPFTWSSSKYVLVLFPLFSLYWSRDFAGVIRH